MKWERIIHALGGMDERGSADLPMALLCGSAFFAAFSLPVGRACAAFALIALVYRSIRERTFIRFPRSGWLWILFTVLATITVLTGPAPEVGLGKLDKLAWFLTIPLAATLARGHQRALRLLTAFSLGACVLALDICLITPLKALQATRELLANGQDADYMWELTTLGGMTDGQILGMAILVSATLLIGLKGRNRWACTGMLAIQIIALLLNLKRGSWMALGLTAAVLVLIRTNWRVLVVLSLIGAAGLLLPPVQSRLTDLRSELSDAKGGRLVMWTKIAPALLEEYPAGVGFRSLTDELMQETATRIGVTVEKDRNHLHNNLVQVTVAMGYAGLVLYLIWMTQGLWDGLRWYHRAGGQAASKERGTALCALLMLCLLLLNGIVEYNLADSELVLIYGMLFGLLGTNALPATRQ